MSYCPTVAYVTAVAVVPTIADTLLLQAASCCRHHDVNCYCFLYC